MFCIPSFDEMTNLTPYFSHVIPAYAGIQTVSHSASQVEEISETGSWALLYHSSLRYIAQILNRSCVNQKKSFGRSTAGFLSGILDLSGFCLLAARYCRLFL